MFDKVWFVELFEAFLRYFVTLAGFILAVFGTGVAVGKIVEKIERLEA